MTPLVRLAQNPVVIGPDFAVEIRIPVLTVNFEDVDPEQAFRGARWAGFDDDVAALWAAFAIHLPIVDEAEETIGWTMAEVRRLRFQAWLRDMGAL